MAWIDSLLLELLYIFPYWIAVINFIQNLTLHRFLSFQNIRPGSVVCSYAESIENYYSNIAEPLKH